MNKKNSVGGLWIKTIGQMIDEYTIESIRLKHTSKEDESLFLAYYNEIKGALDCPGVFDLVLKLKDTNEQIWLLIDKVMAKQALLKDARMIQVLNKQRNDYVRQIDELLFDRDIGEKIYAG